MNWSRASTSLLLVVAMSERLPGLRGNSLRPGVMDTEDIEATRGGPWANGLKFFFKKSYVKNPTWGGQMRCSPKSLPGESDLCLVKEGLCLTGDMEQVSGSVICLTGGVAFLLLME